MTDNIKKGLAALGILILGLAIGRFSLPAKIVEKEHIVYQERIVEKKVEVTNIKQKDHKIYVRIEHTDKDGGKTVETRIMDDKTTDTKDSVTDNKTDNSSTVVDKEKTTTYSQQSTIISLSAKAQLNNWSAGPAYGLLLQKRLIGPLYVGGFGFTDMNFGLSAGLAF